MITLTKIFRFETAHALYGYAGSCSHIHGHSYELHVTVSSRSDEAYIPGQGFILDFKEIKQIVSELVISKYDHALLSAAYVNANPFLCSAKNLVLMNAEPTAENMLIDIRETLVPAMPETVCLEELKLFETADSYATWRKNSIRKHPAP